MINNIDEIRVSDFIESLSFEKDQDILELKNNAIENDVPIIRDETRNLLQFIIKLLKPKSVLEIGTAIAYSTLVIHRANPNSKIVTIENYEKRIVEAKLNIEKYFDKSQIELIEQDAGIFLDRCNDEFDFIFLDAAKAQYINWLPNIKRVLKKDGILISDNIFKDGEILESKFLIRKRDRTIHKRMREYLQAITKDDELDTTIYSIGDGLSISIKK